MYDNDPLSLNQLSLNFWRPFETKIDRRTVSYHRGVIVRVSLRKDVMKELYWRLALKKSQR